jgi:ankyrin repeat protein
VQTTSETVVQRLIAAVREGRVADTQALVESTPALAAARDPGGVSALVLALYHGHADIAQWFAARRTDLDIFEAASLGLLDQVTALVDADATLVAAWSADGFTPLALTSFFGHLPTVRFLLDRGADVNAVARNDSKYTALTGAVTAGRGEVVAALLEHGADATYRYGGGFTPLHIAAAAGRVDIVRLLLEAGAARDARTDDGQTPRDFAQHREQADVVRLLDDWRART